MSLLRWLAGVLFMVCAPLCMAGTFEIVTPVATCVMTKKLQVRFIRGQDEQGIVRRTLCFSVDQPLIQLKKWHTTVPPVRVWNAVLNKKRSLFDGTGEFSLELVCDESLDSFKTALESANFSVSCLIMHSDGTIEPCTQVLQLGVGDMMDSTFNGSRAPSFLGPQDDKKGPFLPYPGETKPDSFLSSWGQPKAGARDPLTTKNLDDNALIESLGTVWQTIKGWFYALVTVSFVWWSFVCVCALVILTQLRRRYSFARRFIPSFGAWEREFVALLVFLAGCLFCVVLACFDYQVACLAFLSCWCLMGMGYAFATPPDQEVFLGRLKKMIGLCLGMAVLPLMLKAYLVYLGF